MAARARAADRGKKTQLRSRTLLRDIESSSALPPRPRFVPPPCEVSSRARSMEQREGPTETSPASPPPSVCRGVGDDDDAAVVELSSAIFLSPMSASMSRGPSALAKPKSTRVMRHRLDMYDTLPSTSRSSLHQRSSSVAPPVTTMLQGWISLCMTLTGRRRTAARARHHHHRPRYAPRKIVGGTNGEDQGGKTKRGIPCSHFRKEKKNGQKR